MWHPPFLDYIGSLFAEGLQYRSINTIRSAVSMTHELIEGSPIGQHPLVKQMLNGVYHTRPPQPRYFGLWEVSKVVNYLANMGENVDLMLKSLLGKLSLLMALVAASHTSKLHALDLRFRVFKPEGALFKLSSLTKKRKIGAPLKGMFLWGLHRGQMLMCSGMSARIREEDSGISTVGPSDAKPLFLSCTSAQASFFPTDCTLDKRSFTVGESEYRSILSSFSERRVYMYSIVQRNSWLIF